MHVNVYVFECVQTRVCVCVCVCACVGVCVSTCTHAHVWCELANISTAVRSCVQQKGQPCSVACLNAISPSLLPSLRSLSLSLCLGLTRRGSVRFGSVAHRSAEATTQPARPFRVNNSCVRRLNTVDERGGFAELMFRTGSMDENSFLQTGHSVWKTVRIGLCTPRREFPMRRVAPCHGVLTACMTPTAQAGRKSWYMSAPRGKKTFERAGT